MSTIADLARVNVLIELFSECAGVTDRDTLFRIAAGRLRWVLEFDRCIFTLDTAGGARAHWLATRAAESLTGVRGDELSEAEARVIEQVIDTGAPASRSDSTICTPLSVAGRTLGALTFSITLGAYGYREMRLVHHAGQYLGALISRLELEEEAHLVSKRKDDILALLGHELRNPLAPIVTAVRLLKLRDGALSRELAVIDRQSQHLVRLVDDLLDVASLTRGKTVLRRAPVEVSTVVARAVEMAAPLLERRGHALFLHVPTTGLVVDADENRLAQVVSNLLTNAAHYTPEGGHIGVGAHATGSTVTLEVWDDGIGIENDALAAIFGLFVQGNNRGAGAGGLGLGLVVVKQLTELHGGSVSVASDGQGKGTRFTITLPLPVVGSLTVPSTVPPPSLARAATARRVLLVDDNQDALDLLSALLERAGHEVRAASDGADALAVLDGFHPAVAVIDISMPVMDGYELAALIRSQRGRDRPYLIALTGFGQPADYARSASAGFDEHLVKPADVGHLLRAIAASDGVRSEPSA